MFCTTFWVSAWPLTLASDWPSDATVLLKFWLKVCPPSPAWAVFASWASCSATLLSPWAPDTPLAWKSCGLLLSALFRAMFPDPVPVKNAAPVDPVRL